jgi:hypothetical protein
VDGTKAKERRQEDATPDAMEIKPDTGRVYSLIVKKNY